MHEDVYYTPEGNIRGRAAELKRLGMYSPIVYFPVNHPDEVWAPITEQAIPGILDGYYVSNYGQVFSTRKGPTLVAQNESYDGYLRCGVRLKNGRSLTMATHRLVMLVFCYFDGCRELQVNHIDANKHNNYIGNLEWCTCAENIHHAVENGLQHHHHGEECNFAVITNEQADMVGKLLAENKYTHEQIANMVGVSKSVVHNISSGTSWKDVYEKYNLRSLKGVYKGHGFSDEELEAICKYFEDNAPYHETLNSLFRSMISDLYNGKYVLNGSFAATLRDYYHGTVRKNITQKYHPQLGGYDR